MHIVAQHDLALDILLLCINVKREVLLRKRDLSKGASIYDVHIEGGVSPKEDVVREVV